MHITRKIVSVILSVTLAALLCCANIPFANAKKTHELLSSPAFLYGDVNRDGKVNIKDATAIQRHLAKMEGYNIEEGSDAFKAADVDAGGSLTIEDVTMIQRFLAKFINQFPAELQAVTTEPTTAEPTTEPTTAEPTTEPVASEPAEPTTAEPTTAEPTTAEPTTAEPTTEEPTTEEPTTAEPTTAEPTTEEPTTAEPTTEPATEAKYVLAGSNNWLSCGWSYDYSPYVLKKGNNGIYSIVVTDVFATDEIYSFKVVDIDTNTWYGIGDSNVDFSMTDDCDVTVTFNPTSKEINVSGNGVVNPWYDIRHIYAVGYGKGGFLNNINWDPFANENIMAEVSAGVYEITFNSVETNTSYQFKFAANGSWDMNWGYGPADGVNDIKIDTPCEATYNGGNAQFEVESEDEYCNITLRLDISHWDSMKKTGAKITVMTENYVEPTTAEPTTAAPTTEPVTTVPPVTTEPFTTEPPTISTKKVLNIAARTTNWLSNGWDFSDIFQNTYTPAPVEPVTDPAE